MATITKQTIKVDLTPGRVYPVLHVSQGDVGLEALEFYIYQNGQPFTISSEVTAINVDGMTPVGVFSYPCTWAGNVVTAGLTATMTAERGVDICELAMYDATNNKIGTCNFVIAVEESPYTNAHVSTSDMATIMAAASSAQQYELLAKSWAVGDTGIRTGEDTNNSEYWANISESWAVGGTGKRTGEDTNNSEYWSEKAHEYANTTSYKKVFTNVAEMIADTALVDGQICRTLGYTAENDGTGSMYRITAAQPSGAYETLSNGLYAEQIIEDIFIDGDYQITRFENEAGQNTFVYWRYIPAVYKPEVAYSEDVDYAARMANEHGATCAVNASRWNTSTGEFNGYFRAGGVTIHGNDAPTPSYNILCYKDGVLSSEPISASTAALDAADYEWALTGFEDIIVNGTATERANPETPSTDYHPRSFIAQTDAGAYIIGCTDGRSGRSYGFTLSDIYRFLVSLGYTINYAYSLDGGASVSLVEKGERVNSYIENDNRQIKSIIYFKKPGAYYNEILKHGTANIDNNYRSRVNSYEYMQGNIISFKSDLANGQNVGIELYNKDDLKEAGYIRLAKNRFHVGMMNDFTTDGTTYTLLNVGPTFFEVASKLKVLINEIYSTVDFTDQFPTENKSAIYCINISDSTAATNLGLSANDYGRILYIRFRTNINYDLILTRYTAYFRTNSGAIKALA